MSEGGLRKNVRFGKVELFLYDMLQRMDFHCKWIKWVRGCLKYTSVSIIVNRSPTTKFKSYRGLR